MRRRIRSFILAVGLLLTMMPDSAMAAKMETDAAAVQESGEQENMAETGRADVTVPGAPLGLEGSGTTADPYRISDAEQLRIFADIVNGAGSTPNTGLCAVLTQNIDLSGECGAGIGSWTPIGTNKNPYTGIFDGGSFVVSGLYCRKSNASYVGLFGCNAGTIKNLGVTGTDIVAGSYTGSVCGFNRGNITGCYNAGAVKGDRYTGGVCGYNDGSGRVSICYNTGTVSGSKYVGGICGYNKNETSDSYNMGTVNGSGTSVGGVCGYNRKLVSGCYNTGEVGGKNYVGSVCGYNHSESTFLNCYYLITGMEKGNYGVAMTQQQFASGEVCWLLNDGKSENVVWHQTCGAGFPAFGGKTVYQMQTYKQNGNKKEVVVAYTNDKNKKGISQAASATPTNSDNNSGETTGESTDGHVYQEPEWKWKEQEKEKVREYKSAVAVFICQNCGEELRLEASISKKTTAATCAAEGEIVYTASVKKDGETYKDEKTVKLAKLAHQLPLVWVDQSEATCETPGYSEGCYTCTACGKCYRDEEGKEEAKQVLIPALGHKWEPNWIPESDYSAVTAVFVCANNCGKSSEPIRVNTKAVSKNATCMVAGTIKYSAVVKFDNKSYTYESEEVQGQTLPHNYSRTPVWDWVAVGDGYSASAVFSCQNKDCNALSEPVPATITELEIKGTDCNSPGKTIYTATAEFRGETYRATKEKKHLAQHSLEKVGMNPATCGEDGNVEYWKCHACGKTFSDEAGMVPLTDVIIPATKKHVFQHVRDNIYKCDVCGGTYIVTESGEATIYSLEEGDVIRQEEASPQNEKENDNTVSSSAPEGKEQNGAKLDEEETTQQPDLEERLEDYVPPTAADQDGQNGENEEGETEGQGAVGEPAGQNEQVEEGIPVEQDEQQESGDGIIDTQEDAARYGIIYPEGEEVENAAVTEGAVEGNAVNLRADTSGDDAAQVAQGQQELPLWGSAAALSLLVGIILCFVLKKENN